MESDKVANGLDTQYGINKIYRFGKRKKNEKLFISQKKELVRIEKKEHATVIKMEFSNNNCFILLSDGRVFSRGGEECLGRASSSSEGLNKTFEEVIFINPNANADEAEVEKSAIIYNISAADEHVLALDHHYNVWGWGNNDYLQVDPKKPLKNIKSPVRVILPTNTKVVQIYALQRSSMIICRNNFIYMWGCISEGYLGELTEKGENYVKDFVAMDKITAYILNDIKKNDENFTEVFINSRKLFNMKYNNLLEDNSSKLNRIDKLQTQISNLKVDIQIRSKQNEQKMQSFNKTSNEKSDKNIVLLQELLKTYEKKLGNISIKKDNLRKELINIEEEINQKNIDLRGSTEQIESCEDKMESFNNEITEIKSTLTEDKEKSSPILKKIGEKNKLLYNLKIYKDSLMNNLQVIIIFLEENEKERKKLADQILKQTDKENHYLKARYTIEDMMMIILESLSSSFNTQSANENKASGSTTEKYKEKYLELFSFSDKLEKITFTELNKLFPYKIIDDILIYSNNEIKSIAKSLEMTKSSLSEMIKENLIILFDIVETKIELIKEQNTMIKFLYNIFTNLETEIREKYLNDMYVHKSGTDDKNKLDKNNIYSHVEYIYKELIVKYFEDAYKGGKKNNGMSIEERDRIQHEQNNYIKDKQTHIKKLEDRNKMYEEIETNFNINSVISFGYNKK